MFYTVLGQVVALYEWLDESSVALRRISRELVILIPMDTISRFDIRLGSKSIQVSAPR